MASNQSISQVDTKVMVSGDMDIPQNADQLLTGSRWSLNSFANLSPGDWYNRQKNSVRSWLEFFNTSRFQIPQSPRRALRRLIRNIEYFQANYLVVFVILALYCVITSPTLLLVIGLVLACCYMINSRHQRSRLSLYGHEIPLIYQYGLVFAISLPVFVMIGATATLFWLLGAILCFITLHSVFYIPIQSEDDFERVEV